MQAYKTSHINNRRYLGNKYKLLPFISRVVREECHDVNVVADIFAGTGAVSSVFQDKILITNDLMYSNYICHYAWFSGEEYDRQKMIDAVVSYNSLDCREENYMTEHFADTYFSRADCAKIGYIREDLERKYESGVYNLREKALLLTALLYAMDKIAKTCGHYDAYRKHAVFDTHLELCVPMASHENHVENQCFCMDANLLVPRIAADLVYIDPPYNSRQYCDAYHLLENVARWEKPPVFGVARKMDRSALKSRYCMKDAAEAFSDLIEHIQSRYILFSYNNMGTKGNERSNAKISDEDIRHILKRKGTVKVFSEVYKAFTTGKSDVANHEERLFLCKCNV
mgnify:CR=1 FL=1